MRNQRRRRHPLAIIILLVGVVATPAWAQGVTIDTFAAENGFGAPMPLDLQVRTVDAFTNEPTEVSNPITGLAGVEIDLVALGRDPVIVGQTIGIDARFLAVDDDFLSTIGVDYGNQTPPEELTGNEVVLALLDDAIASLEDEEALQIGRYAAAGDPLEVPIGELFGGEAIVDTFSIDDLGDDEIMTDLLDRLGDGVDRIFDDGLRGEPREPGFFAHDLLGTDAPPDQPIHTLRDGLTLLMVETDGIVGPANGNQLNELYISFDVAGPLPVDGVVIPGGPIFDNSSVFPNDGFNGSNVNTIFRVPPGADPMLSTSIYQDGFWMDAPGVVPMGRHGNVTVALVPQPLIDATSGLRVQSFVSRDGSFQAGSVGTSSDVPISGSLPVREFAPIEIDPPPRTLATPDVADALEQWAREIGAIPDAAGDAPAQPAQPAQPATPAADPVQPAAPADGPGDDGVPWEPLAIGVGVLAVGGGVALNRRGNGAADSRA